MKTLIAVTCVVLSLSQQASANISNFSFSGNLNGVQYGDEAAADIFEVSPMGSAYTLSFSYDTSLVSNYSSPINGHGFIDVPANVTFTIGGETFTISNANIYAGGGPFDGAVRLAVSSDSVPYSEARLAGYQLLDFSFELRDPTGQELSGWSSPDWRLPSALDISSFADRQLSARFGFGANGSTRLYMSVDQGTPAVPEPASWATMIVGFGLAGAAVRKRQSAPQHR